MSLKRLVALMLSVLPITAVSFAAKASAHASPKESGKQSGMSPKGSGSVSFN